MNVTSNKQMKRMAVMMAAASMAWRVKCSNNVAHSADSGVGIK